MCRGHTVGLDQGWWFKKSAQFLQHMLTNAEGNAKLKGVDVDSPVIEQNEKMNEVCDRTYRAHGWINPHMSSPCHIKKILTADEPIVPRPEEKDSLIQKKLKGGKLMAQE